MASALLDDSLTGVDQDDREVGRRGSGDHVAGVLHMAGSVGDDELAVRGRKVAVGDIDGDSLLALGAESVGEICQIDLAATGDVRGAFEGFDLVLHERLGVVEETSDQGRLAVVDGAAGVES